MTGRIRAEERNGQIVYKDLNSRSGGLAWAPAGTKMWMNGRQR